MESSRAQEASLVVAAFFVGCTLYLSGLKMSLKPEAIVSRCDRAGTCSLCWLGFAELASEYNSYVRSPTRNMAAGACTETLQEESRIDAADMRFLMSQ